MNSNPYHWLIVAGLLAYFWLLIKLAKPKTVTDPVVPTQSSRLSLRAQTVIAWLCALVFGFLTLAMMVTSGTRPSAAPGDVSGRITDFVLELGVPLLFALSVRWTRSLMRTWKAARVGQP